MKNALILFSFCAILASCNCVDGEGPVNSKSYSLEDIRGINVNGSMDVVLNQGSPQSVKMTAQQNILEMIEITVNDGIAYVESQKCYDTNKENVLEITIPRLEELSLQGSGDIEGNGKFMVTELEIELNGAGNIQMDVDAAMVSADLSGAGNIVLSGESKELLVDLNGAGDVDASRLECEVAEADLNGAGDIDLYVTDELDASVSGAGDIRYKGKPDVKSSISGAGSVSPK